MLVAVSFDPWRKPSSDLATLQKEARTSAARGSDIFFGRVFEIRKVAGQRAESGTCATCHNSGTTRWMDIGTTNRESVKGLPVFKITCDAGAAPHPYLGRVIMTQDPGRALITGKCADVGSIVLQQFRGLAARAPYFANGSAKDLDAVIEYYDQRFGIHYTEQEKRDLANFLRVL
jgi:cytochrome c peroxidase